MAVETLSGVPCRFEAGNTVIFEEGFSDYPPSSWAATFYLSKNGVAKTNVVGAESGDAYTFTISASASALLAPGVYDYAIYVVSGSERTTAKTGQITVDPNLAANYAPSHAQRMVSTLEGALLAFGASDKVSVGFNGQTFTRGNIETYRKDLAYWQSRVILEQEKLAQIRGKTVRHDVAPRFTNG